MTGDENENDNDNDGEEFESLKARASQLELNNNKLLNVLFKKGEKFAFKKNAQ